MSALSFSCAAVIGNGTLRIDPAARHQMDAFVKSAPDGLELLISLAEADEIRGPKANAYYWACVVAPAAKHLGYEPEDFHSAMCQMFLPDEHKRIEFYNRVTGENVVIDVDGRRTRKLNRSEFFNYVERVRQFLAESLDFQTEDPDQSYWRKRKASLSEVA